MTGPGPITAAASSGSAPDALKALRDRLAEDLDNPLTPPRDRAALARQFTLVLEEIARIAAPTEESPLDELNTRRLRRAARRRDSA